MKFFLLLLFFTSNAVISAPRFENQFSNILALYKQGSYKKAIERLAPLKRNSKLKPLAYYWSGLCQNGLQDYQGAIKDFEIAISLKAPAKDIYYEYGQALYANQDLKKARSAFKQSYSQRYKKDASLYYIAYISQTFEQYPVAQKYYQNIEKLGDAEIKIKQAARFQLAEVWITQIEKRKSKSYQSTAIEKKIIPQLDKAISIDKNSPIVVDIRKRKRDLILKYDLGPGKWKNGRLMRANPLSLFLRQDIDYNSNVILESTDAIQRAQQKGSLVSTTTGFGSYQYHYKRKIGFLPELRAQFVKHSETDEPSIHQNDAYTIAPALRTSLEHKIGNIISSMHFDIEYDYTARDLNADKNLTTFGKTTAFTIGETLQLVKSGDTSFRFRLSSFKAVDSANDSTTKSFIFTQTHFSSSKKLFLFLFNADLMDNNTDINSTNTYLTRLDYIGAKLFWNLNTNLHLSYSLIDTKKQKPSRGTEKIFTTGFRLTKNIFKRSSLSFTYDFRKKSSKDEDQFSYTQHLTGLELELRY